MKEQQQNMNISSKPIEPSSNSVEEFKLAWKKHKKAERRKQYNLENRDRINEYMRQYRLKNKETLKPKEKEYMKLYQLKNKDKYREKYLKNKEKILERNRERYYKNKAKKNETLNKMSLGFILN